MTPSGRSVFLALAIGSAAAGAQSPQPDAIPRELVVAAFQISRGWDAQGGEPVFTLGAIPEDVKGSIGLPPRSRLLGTVGLGSDVYVLGLTEGKRDDIVRWFSRDLASRGYVRAEIVGNTAFSGGFLPALDSVPTSFCQGNRNYSIAARTVASGAVEYQLRVSMRGSNRLGNCAPTRFSGSGSLGSHWNGSATELPRLINPAPAASGMCGMGGSGDAGTDALLATSLTPVAMLEHYGRQLEKDGWVREPLPPAAVGYWTKRDSAGLRMGTTLSVWPDGRFKDCRRAKLEITRMRWP